MMNCAMSSGLWPQAGSPEGRGFAVLRFGRGSGREVCWAGGPLEDSEPDFVLAPRKLRKHKACSMPTRGGLIENLLSKRELTIGNGQRMSQLGARSNSDLPCS